MKIRDLFALTAYSLHNPAIAIAACRAGARGCLDFEFCGDDSAADDELETIRQTLQRISRAIPPESTFGIKVGRTSSDWLRAILREKPGNLGWILLAGGDHPQLYQGVDLLRELSLPIYFEAISLQEAQLGVRLGAAGLVLKGHESSGRIGEETAFVLLQRWRQFALATHSPLPVWVQGGIGLHSAAGCLAAGAAGVVLDSQLLLARESPLDETQRLQIAVFESTKTRTVGQRLGELYRFAVQPADTRIESLVDEELQILRNEPNELRAKELWQETVCSKIRPTSGAGESANELILLGQDAEFAKSLADRFVTVGGILQAVAEQSAKNVELARQLDPFGENATLAAAQGTRYPLLQGPMTRVSDTAKFAEAVAEGGALPFLALALMRGPETEELLRQTRAGLGDRPWGAGILGFLPQEIRKEQIAAVLKYRPPFALIAGGRPDQAKELEDAGIATYLHVPSPGLLKMFLRDGGRRFIFEGRECGGHVGPRSSFLLWDAMVRTMLEHLGPSGRGDDLSLVFAGGIHDATSAAMTAAIAAPLAERGVKLGLLMGTAYLFTEEAVAAGAIVPRFQQEALSAGQTVLLETGPGHAIRCIRTPYFDLFESEKARLRHEGRSHEEIVKALEWMNIGRLRVASKGLDRSEHGSATKLVAVSDADQFDRGMYMIGQVASMRDKVTTIRDLHAEVVRGASELLASLPAPEPTAQQEARPCDVAIVGMSTFYPDAITLRQYWQNILHKHYAVTEVPATHWDWRLFYDPDPRAKDRIISKWGGFLRDVPFDPFHYGITPKSLKSIEPLQMLALESVRFALEDAGYANRPFDRQRTCAVLGIGGGGSPVAVSYGFRSCLPLLDSIPDLPFSSAELMRYTDHLLPEWTEDSFPGTLMNVTVGRVANRFNFGGANYAIDAACASSLAAVHCCIRELTLGTADVAVAMGADTVQTPYGFMAFSKTHALSPQGRCRPFDEAADGIVLSEGVGAVILKRLADAQRDGDRIYAVIKGVASSSDGREKGLTAPNTTGQLRAIRWAYELAGVSPARAGLIEAHGTGTVVGDRTEAQSISQVMREAGADLQSCAIGSVKSMIGHSKCAAGVAGLIKTAQALYHKVLPPTLVETPNRTANFDATSLYLNAEARPWVHGDSQPRLAGVSAFGFGGTNTHVVLEEYIDELAPQVPPALRDWPAEVFVWRRTDATKLLQSLQHVYQTLVAGASPDLAELAASLWKTSRSEVTLPIVAIVARSLEELTTHLALAIKSLEKPDASSVIDPRGIYISLRPKENGGKVAMLFSGQGSQYPNMLASLAMNFSEVRQAFDDADRALRDRLPKPLGRYVYPPSAFSTEQEQANSRALAETTVAQPAIGAASLGIHRLLNRLGIFADQFAGHSYGEYSALCAAGAFSASLLPSISFQRGHLLASEVSRGGAGGMAAVHADGPTVEQALLGMAGVTLANFNAPNQTVISASDPDLNIACEKLQAANLRTQRLPVSCAFHSPLIAGAITPLRDALAQIGLNTTQTPVYSNVSGLPYPSDSQAMLDQLALHAAAPVRFVEEIEAMYEAGARVFIEVGPQGILTGLVDRILGERPHLAVASDNKNRDGLIQLMHLLGQVLTHGVGANLDPLYQDRNIRTFSLDRLAKETGKVEYPVSTWLVNGIRARPLHAPEPRLLGQAGLPSLKESAEANSKSKPAIGQVAPTKPLAATTSSAKPMQTPVAPQATQPVTPPVTSPVSTSTMRAEYERGSQVARPVKLEPISRNPAQQTRHAQEQVSMIQPLNSDDTTEVMRGFQELMSKFLETQRTVMLSYLGQPDTAAVQQDPQRIGGTPAAARNVPSLPPRTRSSAESQGPPRSPAPMPSRREFAREQPVANEHSHDRTSDGHENGHGNGNLLGNGNGSRMTAQAESAPKAASKKPQGPVNTASNTSTSVPLRTDTVAEPKPNDGLSLEEISERLLDLVSDRTGYPKEMLDIDLDLEADLGIDSIKRVEILGSLAEVIDTGDDGMESNLELEKLTTIRTLRGILKYLEESLFASLAQTTPVDSVSDATTLTQTQTHASMSESKAPSESSDTRRVQRALVRLADAPLATSGSPLIPSGTLLITDDGRGVAHSLARRLSDFGLQAILIRDRSVTYSDSAASSDEEDFVAELTDATAVEQLVTKARRQFGTLAGLIHALPLATQDDNLGSSARARRDVKSLYLLARELEDDLTMAGRDGTAILFAATSLGGGLGFESLADNFSPGQGGVLGFAKCLSMEWGDVTVRSIDFDGTKSPDAIAERLISELNDSPSPVEVGYLGSRRVTWEPVAAPLDAHANSKLSLDKNSVVLVTGGARGITAEIAVEIAKRYQARLILLGRSPSPEQESQLTAALTQPAQIKAALIAECKANGQSAAPAEIESLYRRLLGAREIRQTLERIRESGSLVEYHAFDVRDGEHLAAFLRDLEARLGPIQGVIHGAGVIEDKLVRDKTPESFDRVFDTKVCSALHLSELLNPAELRFCVFFASIASRYGNRGQADYAAANEVLSKLAADLDRKWSARVFSVAWGPWSEIGMVADLEKHLTARGVTLIPPALGTAMFLDELEFGSKGDFEVLIAGGAENVARAPTTRTTASV